MYSKFIKKLLFIAALVITGLSLQAFFIQPVSAYNEYNCDDFSTQEEAQDEYESDTSDPNYLDGDNDGVACESLPSDSDRYDAQDDDSSSYDSSYDSSYNDGDDSSDSSSSQDSSDWSWVWVVAIIGVVVFAVAADK